MRIYLNAENRSGKIVGIGSNDDMTITLKRGNRPIVKLFFSVEDIGDDELVALDLLEYSNGTTTRIIELEGKRSLPEYQTGEKQKGDYCKNCGRVMITSNPNFGNHEGYNLQ